MGAVTRRTSPVPAGTHAWNRPESRTPARSPSNGAFAPVETNNLMSYVAYKMIHLLGIFALMVALAGMAVHAASGHTKQENPGHRGLLILHGLGTLIALTGGFGLLARVGALQGGTFPGWVWGKLVLWVLLGGLIALPYRNRALARTLPFLLPILGLLGGYLANYKPF